jgi:hypothetical protein
MNWKNLLIVIIVIIFLISVILISFILINIENHSRNEKLIITLKPSIKDVNYHINTPILTINNNIPDIVSNLKIKRGNGIFKIDETEYGKILYVSSSNELVLESQIDSSYESIEESEIYFDYEWSTLFFDPINDSKGVYIKGWIDSNNSNLKIYINMTFIGNSNLGTNFEMERISIYEGNIFLDSKWEKIYGYEDHSGS